MTAVTVAADEKLMTADEFFDWSNLPENDNKSLELVRGEVIELPAPTKPHGVVCVNVAFVLSTYARQRRKGYVTSNDAGVILERDPYTVRGPDVALTTQRGTRLSAHETVCSTRSSRRGSVGSRCRTRS